VINLRQTLSWGDLGHMRMLHAYHHCWRVSSFGPGRSSGSGRRLDWPQAWVAGKSSRSPIFLAASANVIFPRPVVGIVRFALNPDIWLSFLIVFGTQWYILFNVIAGASAFPNDLKEAAASFRIHGWDWWKSVIIPGIFPYYVTGALTASGGSWNAAIVAEYVKWGDQTISAHGIGAYIAEATADGDYPKDRARRGRDVDLRHYVQRLLWRPLFGWPNGACDWMR